MKSSLLFLLIVLAFGCKPESDLNVSQPMREFADSIRNNGFTIYNVNHTPEGLTSGEIKGLFNGVDSLIKTTTQFKSLHLEGIRCRWNMGRSQVSKYYYCLCFSDKNEELKFEQIKNSSENYLSTENRKAVYFKKNDCWILEYYPFNHETK